jgi:hypothetical protein
LAGFGFSGVTLGTPLETAQDRPNLAFTGAQLARNS